MKALDQESGAIVGSATVGDVSLVLPNTKNDRIYLLNNSGTIRCYREISSVKPFFHSDEFKPLKPMMKDGEDPAKSEAESPDSDDVDPFGGDGDNSDPFGGDGDNSDPFGGDGDNGDPFGGNGEDKKDEGADDPSDPFGGEEENPFGDESSPFEDENPF